MNWQTKLFSNILLVLLIVSSPVIASHNEPSQEPESECSLTNLGSCIAEKMLEFFMSIINAPLRPLINFVKALLESPVNISLFERIWKIITWAISLLYTLFLIYNGFLFITSSNSAEKRYKAKEALQNTILMIILIQASYLIYEFAINIASGFTSGILELINQDFFLVSTNGNIFLQLFFLIPYALLLLLTALLLSLRYLIVAGGVTLVPIGILLYFFPPVRSYGSFILNFLGGQIFMTIIVGIILLIGSKLLEISLFAELKIIVVMASFFLANLLIVLMLLFSIIKAAFNLFLHVNIFKAVRGVFK